MYNNIILGGTYAAFGFCEANPDGNLMISKNVYIEDYSPAFRAGRVSHSTPHGKALCDYLKGEGAFCGENLNMAAATIGLYKLAERNKYNILYQTFVSKIMKEDGGYTVWAHDWDGTTILRCKNVIDTVPNGKIIKKTMNALITTNSPNGSFDGYEIENAWYEGQRILKLTVPTEVDMGEARLMLIEFLHSKKIENPKLILTPVEFDFTVQAQDVPYPMIVCCNESNPIRSYEKGFALGREML